MAMSLPAEIRKPPWYLLSDSKKLKHLLKQMGFDEIDAGSCSVTLDPYEAISYTGTNIAPRIIPNCSHTMMKKDNHVFLVHEAGDVLYKGPARFPKSIITEKTTLDAYCRYPERRIVNENLVRGHFMQIDTQKLVDYLQKH